jgi:HEAT repeat protein
MRNWILMMLGATLAFGQTQPADTVQRCLSILNDAVHDGNPDGRIGAAQALSLVGVKDNALESLAPMLDDHDASVRIAVVATLGDFKDDRTLPLLKKALRDPVPEVDFAAAKVLYQLHDPEGEQFLLAVVGKESKASSSFLSKEKRSALRMLHTPTKLLITVGIATAGFAPVPGLGFGLSSAQGILSAPDSSARAASLLLIGSSRNPSLADAVGSALSDREWSVRAAAVHLVAMHPFPGFREKLVPLLDDKKEAVRVRAAAAYIRLQHVTEGPATRRGATTH